MINTGLGLNALNKASLNKAIEEVRLISGQQPVITLAKKSIAGFKIRKGIPIGVKVTLRRKKMEAFFEKLIRIILPNTKDFRGMSPEHFDSKGNYNFGIEDQSVFPEIDYDLIEQKRGVNISIVTQAQSVSEGKLLLECLGFPFIKLD